MKSILNFKKTNNVVHIQSTLMGIVARDASNNPELYKETAIIEEMTALQHLLATIASEPLHEQLELEP